MNYTYDIVLNYNKKYYEFFEWNEDDNIINVKKIPVLKISDEDYVNLKYNDVIVSKEFINKINKKTQEDNNKSTTSCIITTDKESCAIRFDSYGNNKEKSSLIFEEEEEIIESSEYYEKTIIEYDIVSENKGRIYSRTIEEKINYLLYFFNSNNEINIYKYIYYDLYEKEEEDIIKIKNNLLQILSSTWNDECNKLYNTIKKINDLNKQLQKN